MKKKIILFIVLLMLISIAIFYSGLNNNIEVKVPEEHFHEDLTDNFINIPNSKLKCINNNQHIKLEDLKDENIWNVNHQSDIIITNEDYSKQYDFILNNFSKLDKTGEIELFGCDLKNLKLIYGVDNDEL